MNINVERNGTKLTWRLVLEEGDLKNFPSFKTNDGLYIGVDTPGELLVSHEPASDPDENDDDQFWFAVEIKADNFEGINMGLKVGESLTTTLKSGMEVLFSFETNPPE